MSPIQIFFLGVGSVILLETVLVIGVLIGHRISRNIP
jgi:hypothetical protein